MNPRPFLALLVLLPSLAAAQKAKIKPTPSALFAAAVWQESVQDSTPRLADHRVTGAVIGGVFGGVLGFVVASAQGGDPTADGCATPPCSEEDSEIVEKTLFTLGGAAVGAGLGYLMGKSTPKASAEPKPEALAPIVDTGIKSSTGAAIGAVAGAVVFGVFAREDSDGTPLYVATIPLGALLGAFVGYGVTRE